MIRIRPSSPLSPVLPLLLLLLPSTLGVLACGGADEGGAPAESASEGVPEAAPEPAATSPEEEVASEDAEPELLPRAKVAEEGVLSGGQPTLEHLDRLAAAGYKTVVNLRGPDEEGQLPEEAYAERGLEYLELPVEGAEAISEENARKIAELVHDPENRPLALHCGSGNRVGALLALEAYHVHGMEPEEAVQVGVEGGMTRLEPVVRERLGLPAEEPEGEGDGGESGAD